MQFVRAGNHGFDAATVDQEIYHAALTLRVERSGWFIQQQHFGIEDKNLSKRDPFLFAAGQPVRCAVFQMLDLQ